jgi:hypothetical protein
MSRLSPLSNSDLEHLNALADGELSEAERAHWRDRITYDSIAQQEFDKIVALKTKLGLMQQLTGIDTNPSVAKRNATFTARWAIAASIALAIVAGGLWFGLTTNIDQPKDLIAWHNQFSGQQYVVKENSETQFVSLGTQGDILVPDLEPSKLFLVDTIVIKESDGRAVMHYRGLSGCRLTIWTGLSIIDLHIEQSATQRSWTAGNQQFAMIATGMDEMRFQSIAEYVQTLTRLSVPGAQQQRVAMADVYKISRSCA